jgi:small conductance mechanosensitive channel
MEQMIEAIKNYFADQHVAEILISAVISLALALLIFYVGKTIARMASKATKKILTKREVDAVLVDFLGMIVSALILVVTVVAAFDQLGIPAASFLAIVGAAGLAVGLAMKDSLSNFASGVMLVMFRPFTKGDFIDGGGVTGTVDEVRLVSTTLTTPDNKLITVPNAVMFNGTITNFSAKETRRLDMVIGVSYDDDLKVVADVLKKICKDHPDVLDEPATGVFISNLGDSSVDFSMRPWVATDKYWPVRAQLLESAKIELEAAGCNIPYPQTDVHLHKAGE